MGFGVSLRGFEGVLNGICLKRQVLCQKCLYCAITIGQVTQLCLQKVQVKFLSLKVLIPKGEFILQRETSLLVTCFP